MSRFENGRFTNWSRSEGLGNNHVLSFHEDKDGALWVGTHGGGLSRLKNNRLTTITTRDGLYDNLAFQILEDDAGNLWMSGNRGIYRASLQELNDFADGRTARVSSFAYGVGDGMLSRECNGAAPAGGKTADGRLWFPTVRGLVSIRPSDRNTQPPLVAIEAIAVDRRPVSSASAVRIEAGQHDLEVVYTALSWRRPQHVRFRYRLIGLDQDWIEAGTRRSASYARLPPGTYVFQVIADNGDGVWNPEGQRLTVTVVPAFHQTTAFLALLWLAGLGSLGLAWHYRVRNLQRSRSAQQAFSTQLIGSQETERKRIASELHDSLGQHLLIINNRAELARRAVAGGTDVGEQISEIAASASSALSEVRSIAYNLRPPNLDRLGLTAAIEEMIEAVSRAGDVEFTADVEQADGLFDPDHQIIVYRIVQESITNIVKHAGATRAGVEIWREDRTLYLVIRDNGRGFSAGPGAAPGTGGLGLTSIAERVRMLGGTHAITTRPGGGTEVSVQLPIPPDGPEIRRGTRDHLCRHRRRPPDLPAGAPADHRGGAGARAHGRGRGR